MANQPLEDGTDPTYTHFEHRDEFMELLDRFMMVDVSTPATDREDQLEGGMVKAMGNILDYYLPLPGLLDPSLGAIVPPLLQLLGHQLQRIEDAHDAEKVPKVDPIRLGRIGRVIYWVVKVRGWKAVVPHLPSSIPYLTLLITLLSPPTVPSSSRAAQNPHDPLISLQSSWELRVVLLLWLSLLLTVPFDLTALSDNSSPALISPSAYGIDLPAAAILFSSPTSSLAQKVTLLAIPLLFRPGKEGTYSALLLARLFSREDSVAALPGFFLWAKAELAEGERDGEANFVSSILTFLSVMPTLVAPRYLGMLWTFEEEILLPHLRGSRTAASSGMIRKLAVKSRGRWWVAKLGKGYVRVGGDVEMPEGIDEEVDDLMGGLGDKDTIVRYSSAKYLARLASLLPPSLQCQIIQAVISLFAGTEEEPAISTDYGAIIDPGGSEHGGGTMGFGGLETSRGEARWHGVCLALAECGRRGLIGGEQVEEALDWVLKALTFDLRRASHSIGANVRDAASYLLWSLSRACPPAALAPFAEKMATRLICVAVFDREVGVRRAASAAFQEGVGRLGLYPEGIDVLGKTDFYSVSVRRMAFTVAAPAVAIHEVYRQALREHLHHITLRHWDTAMRILGANALRSVLELDDVIAIEDSLNREVQQISSLDAVNVHGALTALAQIALIPSKTVERQERILMSLSQIRPATLVSPQGADIIQSACELISASATPTSTDIPDSLQLIESFLEHGMKRREPEVHEAVAEVFGRLSDLNDYLKASRASVKQCSALSLGRIRFDNCRGCTGKAVKALLSLLDSSAKADVETRRNSVRSLGDIVVQTTSNGHLIEPEQITQTILAFINALTDYSTDQRGDVGSWVRLAALTALGKAICVIARRTLQTGITGEKQLVSQATFELAIEGIVKQAVEKLLPLREEAGKTLHALRAAGAGDVWVWDGMECLKIVSIDDGLRYSDGSDWFESSLPLLKTRYRIALLAGLVQSIGNQVQTISSIALQPLLRYLPQLDTVTLTGMVDDLSNLLYTNINQNRVFIPTMQSLLYLLQGGLMDLPAVKGWEDMSDKFMKIIGTVTRGIGGIKSIERITGTMKLIVAFLVSPESGVRQRAIISLSNFLCHRFPRIRAMTAEHLYLFLSGEGDVDEELEEVLLGTEWTGDGVGEVEGGQVIKLLLGDEV